jgi:hypothetical protein
MLNVDRENGRNSKFWKLNDRNWKFAVTGTERDSNAILRKSKRCPILAIRQDLKVSSIVAKPKNSTDCTLCENRKNFPRNSSRNAKSNKTRYDLASGNSTKIIRYCDSRRSFKLQRSNSQLDRCISSVSFVKAWTCTNTRGVTKLINIFIDAYYLQIPTDCYLAKEPATKQ